MKQVLFIALTGLFFISQESCQTKVLQQKSQKVKLLTLEPGHFHAALVQKSMYPQVDSTVHVYSSVDGPELKAHLTLVDKYNTRAEEPTAWNEKIYTGTDFLDKMLSEKKGNVVVLAGNNRDKTDYIVRSINAGINVLADKPMAINEAGFEKLKYVMEEARKKKLVLFDIMTERFEITNMLQKEFMQYPDVFGELVKGTQEEPAIQKESVHHIFKYVSGAPLVRPAWFFDVDQQGNGIVDVTTHLVDLIQWECFPNQLIDYTKDLSLVAASRSATVIPLTSFKQVTGQDRFPAYLSKDVRNGVLNMFSNGVIDYTLKGVHARVSVIWNFQAPEGAGDTHFSIARGTKSNVIIRQGKEEGYKPMVFIEPLQKTAEIEAALKKRVEEMQQNFPGVGLIPTDKGWKLSIPEKYSIGHEAHFAQVVRRYLDFLPNKKIPDWEDKAILAKYFITTKALSKAMEIR
jgi:hypothetical protein